jgi:RNA polymerase sigma-70 factor (ECF subfamily)
MMNRRQGVWVERLFSRHGKALEAFFRRRIRAVPDAPDLAQEVYVRMLRVKDADAIRDPELYLYTVANNLVKENALADSRRNACQDIDDFAIQEQLGQLPSFDSEIDTEARSARLREVLAQLSPKCRAAVILQYREGLSYQEIGAHLGVSAHMVKKYISQALRHCRRRMESLR